MRQPVQFQKGGVRLIRAQQGFHIVAQFAVRAALLFQKLRTLLPSQVERVRDDLFDPLPMFRRHNRPLCQFSAGPGSTLYWIRRSSEEVTC